MTATPRKISASDPAVRVAVAGRRPGTSRVVCELCASTTGWMRFAAAERMGARHIAWHRSRGELA